MISDFLYTVLKTIKSRIFIISLILIGLFSVLVYRIFDLQIINENYYMSTYIQKAEKTVYSSGTRGKILDVNGKVLAHDELAYTIKIEDKIESSNEKNDTLNAIVYKAIHIIEDHGDKVMVDFPISLDNDGKWVANYTSDASKKIFLENIFGKGLKRNGKDYSNASAGEIIHYLKNELFEVKQECSDELLLKLLAVRYNVYAISSQKYLGVTIAKEVSNETVVAIYENEADLTGVTVEEQTIRKYTMSEYFAPIIGYTGTISDSELEEYKEKGKKYIASDIVGKSGLEASMEEYLQGKRGEEKIFVDNTGKVLSTISKKNSAAGNDVYLTIDSKLQKAVYTMLEKRIAAILISEIVNYDVDDKNQTDEKLHKISAKKVYSQLVTNNVVSLKNLSGKKSTSNERNLNEKYKKAVTEAVGKISSDLNSEGTKYNDFNDEYQEYCDYIYDLLKNDGILIASSINTEDETYLKYVDGDLSLNNFIKHAIKMNWINLDNLEVEDSYLSTGETYNLIRKHIIKDIKKNTSFGKLVVKYRIFDSTISGSQICMLLYDQGVLEKDERTYNLLSTHDSYQTYQFLIKQIKTLKITPAQIALDPCSGSVVMTDPNTGNVRAMVTYPSYDNNMLSGTVDPEYWAKLIDDQSDPLYNRATQGSSAPGSTFKMSVAMAVLEEGIISPYTTVNATGKFEKIKPSPKCWIYPQGTHGNIDVMGAIAHSCNYFFYEMGYQQVSRMEQNTIVLWDLKKWKNMQQN